MPAPRLVDLPRDRPPSSSSTVNQPDVNSEGKTAQALQRTKDAAKIMFRLPTSYGGDAFHVMGLKFNFQAASVKNQREGAVSTLASRFSRAVDDDNRVPGGNQRLQVLKRFRDELLSNYTRWCAFLCVDPVAFTGSTYFAHAEMHATGCEAALMLLIWGEAANLRFCPEFICFLFHKMATALANSAPGTRFNWTPNFLRDIISPAYNLLADQLSGGGDPRTACNYDDFNEIFWSSVCLKKFEIATMFNEGTLEQSLRKTFVERQGWFGPIFSFWRVYTLHIFGLHVLIVSAKCELGLGACDSTQWGSTVITLYACSLLRDMWEVIQALVLCGMWCGCRGVRCACSGQFRQLLLNIVRFGLKALVTTTLVSTYMDHGRASFAGTAGFFFFVALCAEALMFTEFWWGNTACGKRDGFAKCFPSRRMRQVAWSVIGTMFGIRSVNLYTQVHSLPPLRKRLAYTFFWAIVLTTKISFSYQVVVKNMTLATYALLEADPTVYDWGLLGAWTDSHNSLYIVALWLGSGLIYFLDMQVWFVLWSNITAAGVGMWRRVGELHDISQVVPTFSKLHLKFFSYLNDNDRGGTPNHARFAYVWNEIVDAMRDEDIISSDERTRLRCFLISLQLPNGDFERYSPDTQERGEWGRPCTLLPDFLMSGAVQRAVRSSTEFGKEVEKALAQNTSEVDAAKLAKKQAEFLESNWNDEVSTEMVRQLSVTTFFLIDALCGKEELSRSLWNLHRALFPGDVKRPGRGVGRRQGVKAIAHAITKHDEKPIFSIQNFAGFISAMLGLVKALNTPRESMTTEEWDRNAVTNVDRMVAGLLALLETEANPNSESTQGDGQDFLRTLQNVRDELNAWKRERLHRKVKARAQQLKGPAREFLARTELFLGTPANTQPGQIKGAEARRRITFFANSLSVEQPDKKRILEMPALTTLTPYYEEEVVLSIEHLRQKTQDGVTVLEYLRSIYPDEFDNLVQRVKFGVRSATRKLEVSLVDHTLGAVLDTELDADLSRDSLVQTVKANVVTAANRRSTDSGFLVNLATSGVIRRKAEEEVETIEDILLELQMWASHRHQTLARTVRGIMYYDAAVRLLGAVENMSEFQPTMSCSAGGVETCHIRVADSALNKKCDQYRKTEQLADAKYTYVVSCQNFAKMQSSTSKEHQAKVRYIKLLARRYPALRIAYVDNRNGKHESVLVRTDEGDRSSQNRLRELHRIQLPGNIRLGEGKPNNQNHAIIFTRGEAVQAIDMNQDAALEDAIKIRQVMEEFKFAKRGTERGHNLGRIVGFREHVFTHDVSTVANFFSLQELNFVSATQRVLDNPLHVRFHYGHPDCFDRMSAITMGGISKACTGVHLSEDIFAGFNFILRGGEATQSDYIQVSKGRDTGVSQVTAFTAKISMGNGMQARSREVSRLASQFDLLRLLSFYYSSVGGFMNQVLLMAAIFLYVYAKLFIAFDPDFLDVIDDTVIAALSGQFLLQLGFLLVLPIPLLLAVEQGLQRAVSSLFSILVRLGPFFFIFSAGTTAHHVDAAAMRGQAKYQATGRGFGIEHEFFKDMFPLYLVSHFNPAFELLVALVVYSSFSTTGYALETFSVYLFVVGLLWTPLVFNPNGLDFSYASQDFSGWLKWMNNPVDDPKKGWLSWFNGVLNESQGLPRGLKIWICLFRSRLLIIVYGLLTAIGEDYEGGIAGDLWPGSAEVGTVMMFAVVLIMFPSWIWYKCVECFERQGRKVAEKAGRFARLSKLAVLVGLVLVVIVAATIDFLQSSRQFFFYILSFCIIAYYVAQIVALFMPDALRKVTLLRLAFKAVHLSIGMVIMLPVLVVSFFPLFVDLQTRLLFNEDFSQRFYIAKIFARQSKRRVIKKND